MTKAENLPYSVEGVSKTPYSLPILLDVLGFKTTGDELFWAALGGIDGDALGGLDLAAVSLVAPEIAATPEARDFGASAAEPPSFLHGGIRSRGNLIEDSEVAVGDGVTAFGSLSLEVILMVTFCLLGGGGFDGCCTVSKGSASMGLTLEDLALAIKSLPVCSKRCAASNGCSAPSSSVSAS